MDRWISAFVAAALASCTPTAPADGDTDTAAGVESGDSGTTVTPSEDEVRAMVGPDGGRVVLGDGEVVLQIPPGALAETLPIVIARKDDVYVDALTDLFQFTPTGTTFAVPATVSFALQRPTRTSTVRWATSVAGPWTELETTTVSGRAAANLDHFSVGHVVPASVDTDTAGSGDSGDSDTDTDGLVDTGDSGATGDSGDSGTVVDPGDSGDSGDAGDSGTPVDSGDSADTDSGDSGLPATCTDDRFEPNSLGSPHDLGVLDVDTVLTLRDLGVSAGDADAYTFTTGAGCVVSGQVIAIQGGLTANGTASFHVPATDRHLDVDLGTLDDADPIEIETSAACATYALRLYVDCGGSDTDALYTIPDAYKECTADEDCTLLDLSCSDCCQYEGVAIAFAELAHDIRLAECIDYGGPVCACLDIQYAPACDAGLCIAEVIADSSGTDTDTGSDSGTDSSTSTDSGDAGDTDLCGGIDPGTVCGFDCSCDPATGEVFCPDIECDTDSGDSDVDTGDSGGAETGGNDSGDSGLAVTCPEDRFEPNDLGSPRDLGLLNTTTVLTFRDLGVSADDADAYTFTAGAGCFVSGEVLDIDNGLTANGAPSLPFPAGTRHADLDLGTLDDADPIEIETTAACAAYTLRLYVDCGGYDTDALFMIPDAYKACDVDEDCTLIDVSCADCCQYEGVAWDFEDLAHDIRLAECADYGGPVCDCLPIWYEAACENQLCVPRVVADSTPDTWDTGDDTGADDSDVDTGDSDVDTMSPPVVDPGPDVGDFDVGDLVITEVMWDPDCGALHGQYVEIHNATEFAVPLNAVRLRVTGQTVRDIPLDHATIEANDDAAIVRDDTGTRCWIADHHVVGGGFADFALSPGQTYELLWAGPQGDVVIDRVDTTGWLAPAAGRSLQLDQDKLLASANDYPQSWCPTPAIQTFRLAPPPSTDFGTPAAPNDYCGRVVETDTDTDSGDSAVLGTSDSGDSGADDSDVDTGDSDAHDSGDSGLAAACPVDRAEPSSLAAPYDLGTIAESTAVTFRDLTLSPGDDDAFTLDVGQDCTLYVYAWNLDGGTFEGNGRSSTAYSWSQTLPGGPHTLRLSTTDTCVTFDLRFTTWCTSDLHQDASPDLDPAWRDCDVDDDCTLIEPGCDDCCWYRSVNVAHLDDAHDRIAAECAGYNGAVCDCWYVPTVARCENGSCRAVELPQDTDTDTFPEDTALTIDEALPGDLIITEVHASPLDCVDRLAEFVEIQNVSDAVIDIRFLEIDIDGTYGRVMRRTPLAPGEAATMVPDEFDPTRCYDDGPAVAGYYPNRLAGTGSVVTLYTDPGPGPVVFDEVDLRTFPPLVGASWQLDPAHVDAALNDDPAFWCASESTIPGATTDRGTPGFVNHPCPVPDTFVPHDTFDGDSGDSGLAAITPATLPAPSTPAALAPAP